MVLAAEELVAFVPAVDLDRARAFYVDVLGCEVLEVNPYACVLAASGTGTVLRVTRVDELAPQPFTVLGWAVGDIGRAAADLTARGVELRRYDGMPQDADGVWTAPGGSKIAWFADPDGNVLSLTQHPA